MPSSPLGLPGAAFQGANAYTAENPPYGAVFTYYLKDAFLSQKERRQKAEAAKEKQGGDVGYPSWDSLKTEDREEGPAVVVTVSDSAGNVVRRFTGPTTKGINRVAWDLRLPPSNPVDAPPFHPDPNFPFGSGPRGPYAPPGTYQVALSERDGSTVTALGAPQRFRVVDVDSGLPGRAYASIGDEERVRRHCSGKCWAPGGRWSTRR